MITVDLSTVSISTYKEMFKWSNECLNEKSYIWHHQPSRDKYWIDFKDNISASMFLLKWPL